MDGTVGIKKAHTVGIKKAHTVGIKKASSMISGVGLNDKKTGERNGFFECE